MLSQLFCYSDSSKNITCLSGKLKTEFTGLIAKSTSPGLSDTTLFVRWQTMIDLSGYHFPCVSYIDSDLTAFLKFPRGFPLPSLCHRQNQDKTKSLAPVVQKLDSAIHIINDYPAEDKCYRKQLCSLLDSDSDIHRLNNPGLVRCVCEPLPKSLV